MSASFMIGGPGLIAYKWRLDGGAWSAPITIGNGAVFPRGAATVRQSTLNLTNLASGAHTLEVLGQDFAGNWQDADPAKAYTGRTQFTPTVRNWSIVLEPTQFAAWSSYYNVSGAASDGDTDGMVALMEYGLGTNPNSAGGRDGVASLPKIALAADGRLEIQFDVRQVTTAVQGHGLPDLRYTVEASGDLSAWTTIATKTYSAAWSGPATVTVGNPNAGFVPITVHDVGGTSQRFLRLRVALVP